MTPMKYLLTDLQREVAHLRLQGYTYKQIAERLGIAYATVRGYVMAVYQILDVHNLEELYGAMLAQEQAS